MPSILSTPQSVYEEDLAEETAEKTKNRKKSKNLKKKKKNRTSLFFKFFEIAPQKRCPGERRLHPQRPKCVFEEDEA